MITIGDKKMKSFGGILRQALLVILCGIFLGVFIFAAHELYFTLHGYRAAEKAYESLNDQFVSTQTAAEVTPEPAPEETAEPEETAPPVVSGDIDVDFAALQAVNPQVVGWIYSPNTVISYPVLKGGDNDYYLSHLYDGSASANGSIFMDCVCEANLTQDNTILYGHHMNNVSMFASINNYIYEGYLEEHPVLYYYTPDGNYMLQVFACFVTGGNSDVYAFNFATRDQFQGFIDRMRSRSNFDAPDVTVTSSDRIMTLSTCAYDYDDARYVVLCKIVPM